MLVFAQTHPRLFLIGDHNFLLCAERRVVIFGNPVCCVRKEATKGMKEQKERMKEGWNDKRKEGTEGRKKPPLAWFDHSIVNTPALIGTRKLSTIALD